jgi:LPS export ABC transporter protein LptC/lipopolysaccharide transport protein LptA
MAATDAKRTSLLHFKARLPLYFRVGAVVFLGLTIAAVVIGYYRARSNAEFRMVGFPAELSKDVVATVSGYERREADGETLKYLIKADTATTFSDNHQELTNVHLQLYADDGNFDEITGQKAVYIPAEDKNFTGYFAGNVVIFSRDKLKLQTEQVSYSKATDVANADESIRFERFNMKGSASSASLHLGRRQLELNRNVEVEIAGGDGTNSRLYAQNASYDQNADRLELTNGARLEKLEISKGRNVDSKLAANRVVALLKQIDGGGRIIERAELYDDVAIERSDSGNVVAMKAKQGSYDRPAERLELNDDVTARITRGDSVYEGRAGHAVYLPAIGRAEFTGGARIQNGENHAAGQSLVAFLNANYDVSKIEAEGSAQLRQVSPEQIVDVSSERLISTFTDQRTLANANARGQSEIIRTASSDGSKLTISASTGFNANFRGAGLIESMDSDGRTTVRLDVTDNGTDSAVRSVTADEIKTTFQPDGKNLRRADASGNAEFVSTPHRPAPENYVLKTEAPRFECDFFDRKSDPRTCVASGGTKSVRIPTVKREGRGEQSLASAKLAMTFDERTSSIARLDADGKAKFTELDRTAAADTFAFINAGEVVQLRGGEPTAWDSRARVKAREIDWDTRAGKSYYRGSVSATYYSAQSVGRAAPFNDQGKPFYVTSQTAELDHRGEVGLFTGNARGWQGSNYVRGETLEFRQRESQLNATGGVQSLLYDVRKPSGGDASLPVFAAASVMRYDGNAHIIRYENGVDIRQGTDRMGGGTAVIQLNERNEMVQTNVDSNVTLAQAGRKASADSLLYTAADDRLMLRGRPARVEDKDRGSSQGEELTFYLSDNRMTGEGRSKANPSGRVRNVYKVK